MHSYDYRRATGWQFCGCCALTLFHSCWSTFSPDAKTTKLTPDAGEPAVRLQLVSIGDGFRLSAFGTDPERARGTAVYKAAASVGVELPHEADPIAHASFADGRMFFLLYKTAVLEGSNRPLLVQRVHRHVANYAADDAEPQCDDAYLVEAFKCADGRMKRPDQHFGSFAIGPWSKRVIEKTFEIGIPLESYADNQGRWPFDPDRLYHEISPYGQSRDEYDAVSFRAVARWTLRLEFDAAGNYTFEAPELGVRMVRECPAPAKLPSPAARRGQVEAPTGADKMVLVEGVGMRDFAIGDTTERDVRGVLGEPVRIVSASRVSRTLEYAGGLAFNFTKDRLNTVIASVPFAGGTSKGITIGADRGKVLAVYGTPRSSSDEFVMFDGVGFWFSADKVVKIVALAGQRVD